MIDHLGLRVSDFEKSKRFFMEALKPLGYEVVMEFGDNAAGFGVQGKPDFWIVKGDSEGEVHVAFACTERQSVDDFHAAALAAGGRDNGAPGLRPHYHADYYGAFVHDLDGNNIEAVCHKAD